MARTHTTASASLSATTTAIARSSTRARVTGFVAESIVLPDDGASVIVLTNHMAGGASEIGQLAVDAMTGGKQNDAEKQALAIYRSLQKGEIDRSLLAPNLNDYFDAQTVEDFKNSLGPLGEPLSFQQASEELRGGMTGHSFRITYPTRRLTLTTYTYPDGKLEQYLIYPAD